MAIIPGNIVNESRDRYLTYALSVVSGRALPDVRDGLKPVQRRILYAMFQNLRLLPDGPHKKCAAVVGEVLARFHPHGDIACYDALVRMAQSFSMRYPLIDGQGNFGSLDGDSAAAYRYTEAKLKAIAIELIGEINEETVEFVPNFDSSTEEPVVFPSRLPQLLLNGVTGIAVGMATNIPPHNLRDTVKATIQLLENPEASAKELAATLKGPDFPTGCIIVNTKTELENIYTTGKGNVVMRGEWELEEQSKGRNLIIIKSIPYAINKSDLVEKIASLIIDKKVPQLNDIRDESTDVVRVVMELNQDADADTVMNYLFKNTTLESNFSVSLTALLPIGKTQRFPKLLNLKEILQNFVSFRFDIVKKRLAFEKKNLLARIHILEGFVIIFDDLDTAIKIVRQSSGRSDAAEKLAKRFKLTEIQSFAIVDLRIYQLSKTNIDEIILELRQKQKRVQEIDAILGSEKKQTALIKGELEGLAEKYGDKRLSKIVKESSEIIINEADFFVKEDVHAIITKDGWVKRIRQNNELSGTRLRDGDEILAALPLTTLDKVLFITSFGNMYGLSVNDFPSSSGYGSPVQKLLKFKDGEQIIGSFAVNAEGGIKDGDNLILISKEGQGLTVTINGIDDLRKAGKRLAKIKGEDFIVSVCRITTQVVIFTKNFYTLKIEAKNIPSYDNPAQGVCLIDIKDGDSVVAIRGLKKEFSVKTSDNKLVVISSSEIESGKRAQRGVRLKKNTEINSVE